jgi:hypothetical protein
MTDHQKQYEDRWENLSKKDEERWETYSKNNEAKWEEMIESIDLLFTQAAQIDKNQAKLDAVVWTSLSPLPRWVLGPTTRWAPGTTRLALHGT